MTSPALPAPWLRSVSTGIPALARDIVDAVLDEVPDYRAIGSPMLRARAQRTVTETLHSLFRWLSGPPSTGRVSPSVELLETFREIGRYEARAGRSHDTLQAAYRIASRVMVRRLLEWEREFPIQGERAAEFSAAVFRFVDDLAEHSAQGYVDALGQGPSVDRERARLLSLIMDARGYAADAVIARAERLHWTVPASATVIDVVGLPEGYGELALARLGRALVGARALAGRAASHDLLISPETPDPDVLTERLADHEPGAVLIVGFQVPMRQLASSLRWIRRLGALRETGRIPNLSSQIVSCELNSLPLMQDAGRDVYQRLVERRLAPLLALSPGKRLKYGRLLSAWLELGGTRGEAPGVLDKHRQTIRYQMTRLEEMFGAQLSDREARVELMLALRAALPEWERVEARHVR